jgi:hypothetical protein
VSESDEEEIGSNSDEGDSSSDSDEDEEIREEGGNHS